MSGLTFCIVKSKSSLLMRRLSLWLQKCFSSFHVHTIVIFQNHPYIQNLVRSPSKCMSSEMSRFVTHRQESPLTFGNSKLIVLGVSTSLDNVVDVIAAVTNRLYFV